MDPAYWERLQDLFCTALELPPEERPAWLERLAGADQELRAEVQSMLVAHEDTGALKTEGSILGVAPGAPTHAGGEFDRAGMRAGAWRLIRLLGLGGMGEVWLAERADGAFTKQAAVKFVHSGWRRAELVRRFERERQLLARLEHPNIARLLDGGTTDDGVPFLAMEYVEGRSILEWCDERHLPVAGRLRLFGEVCEAVRFAHANLIVHRDIKPANILVTAEGRPVLLDFGIARLLGSGEGTDGLTRVDDRLLTPDCAAPEQLRGEPVTTATDVWALGVLLYQLLVGVRPFGRPGGTATDTERRVLHDDPPRPGVAALAPGEEGVGQEERARRRGTTPAALARQLRGDLEPIVLTALRKEPERRYRSAEELGEDVDNWLTGRPVRAQPDSLRYRTMKQLRRNPLPAALITLVILSLSAISWLMTAQARRLTIERDRAHAEEAKSERVLSVLVELFRVSDPAVHPGGDTLRVADLLRIAETRIPTIQDQPEVQTRLWETIADIHTSRSEFARARAAIVQGIAVADSAGLTDRQLTLRHMLARMTAIMDGPKAAEPLFRASLAAHIERFGERHLDTTEAMQNLADYLGGSDEAFALLTRSLEIRRQLLPSGGLPLAGTYNALGVSSWSRGDIRRARDYFAEAAAILKRFVSADDPRHLTTQLNVASCDGQLGRYEDALRTHRELAAAYGRLEGAASPSAATNEMNIGLILTYLGRYAESADTLRLAYDSLRRLYGPDHALVMNCSRNLAYPLVRTGAIEEGMARMHAAHEWFVRQDGPHSGSALYQEFLNEGTELCLGRPVPLARAESLLVRFRALPEPEAEHLPDVMLFVGTVATLSADSTTWARAETILDEALPALARGYPETHPVFGTARLTRELARWKRHGRCDRALIDRLYPQAAAWGMNQPPFLEQLRRLRDAS